MKSNIRKRISYIVLALLSASFLLGLEGDSIYEGLDLRPYVKKASLDEILSDFQLLR